MRVGANFLLAANALGEYSDASPGSAMAAPMPRSNWRRDRLAWRSAARLLVVSFFMSIAHRGGCLNSHLLEWRRLDDAHQQCGKTPVIGVEPVHDPVDGFHVVILRAAPGSVCQQLSRQGAIELLSMVRGEDLLELPHAGEGFPGDEVALRLDGLFTL